MVPQSDDDISCSPRKKLIPPPAWRVCLSHQPPGVQGWGRVLVSLAYALLGFIFGVGTSSTARPPLPACRPFFYTLQRIKLKALS